jgi:predicted PurR-regulated permease PerM
VQTEPPLLPRGARRTAAWCAVFLLVSGVAAIVIWLATVLKAALIPVLLALLGTALLRPLYRRLLALRLSPSLAAALTCIALIAVVGGVGYIVASSLIASGDRIIASLRHAAKELANYLNLAGTSLDELASRAKDDISKFAATAATGLLTGVSIVSHLIATSILALILTFFFLRDSHKVAAALQAPAPHGAGPRVVAAARRAFQAVEGFMRGTTVIALIDAFFITVGLLILRVPGAVGLGALVFVGAYIPFLGAFISGAVAVLVALADRGFVIALWALGVVVAVQQLEGHVLQPVVQSRTVQMHPAMVMIAITAGASVAGILGMLLAVPLTSAAFGVIGELRDAYATDSAGSGSTSESGESGETS